MRHGQSFKKGLLNMISLSYQVSPVRTRAQVLNLSGCIYFKGRFGTEFIRGKAKSL